MTAVLLAAGLAALPWWLGAAVRAAGRIHGLEAAGYERIGYARFALTDVTYTRPGLRVNAGRVETDTPLLWAWRRLRGAAPAVTVDHWSVVVTPKTGPGSDGPSGLVRLHGILNRVASALQRWLPRAEAHHGVVRWPQGGLRLAEAGWVGRGLRVRGLGWREGSADGSITFGDDGAIAIEASQAGDIAAQVRWSGADVAGEFFAWKQKLPVHAHFGDQGWLPLEATAEATDWTVESARVGLGGEYAALRGGERAVWRDGGFQISLQASARPLKEGTVPPLTLQAEARGDRQSWTVTALHLAAPFAGADLSDPVVVGFDGRIRSGPARLSFRTDLSRQPWVDIRGRATGEIRLTAGVGQPVGVEYTGEIEDLAWRDVVVPRASVAGSLAWPRLEVTRGDVVLDAGSRVALQGVYDLHAKSVATAKIEGHLAPAWLQRWLPAGVAIGGADFNATASGPVTGLEHAGELRLTSVQMSPSKLAEARATWRSRGAALDDVALHVAAGATTLDLAGDVRDGRATLKSLHFAPAGSEVWQLADPVAIEWQPAWRIAGLHLRGPDSRVSVDWAGGEAGTLEVGIEKLKSAWWRDVIDLPGPDWQLQTLRFKGGLVGGKLGFAVEAQGEIELSPRPANVALTATGDADGVRLTGLKIVEGGRVLAQAQGRLPVVWDERARPVLRVDLQAPFELRATTEPSSPLWAALAQSLGLGLDGPAADVQVGGTLANPTGELHLAVDRLTIPPGRAGISLPAIEKLALTVHAGRGVLTLDELTARVDGQPVRASGHLPMDEARWRQLARNRSTFDWSKAEGRIDIAEADMAPIARYLPAYLATQGKLQAHVAFSHGELSGELKLREAATRPLPALGIVQEISADVTLDGRTLNIRSFSGKLGGQPCTLQGSIGLQTGAAPRYALALKGEGVPLVRQAGLLVRSDLDLHALTDAAGVTRIEGSMNITDCLILSDLRALLPTGERGVARPPPYFSLDTAPFSSWPLAVELRATHTVRIRTAVFNGTASAHFQLSGTLGSPVAVGETTIDQGQVGFPFVAFNVQFGAVRLTGADPYHPQLSVNGTARRFGYDLRMQSQGPVDQPTVTFTSNPALESEQVLLMVMAGQAPTGDNTVSGSQQRLSRLSTYFGQSLFQQFGVGSDRLEITSGEQVSEKGRETYKIDYKLADRWSLVGEYDEFDDYNAGVKWRVYTSGGKSDIK